MGLERDAASAREGWWGGLVIEFGPDVTGEQANDLVVSLAHHLGKQKRIEIVKVLPFSPGMKAGLRDA